jgi:hypothetical protein
MARKQIKPVAPQIAPITMMEWQEQHPNHSYEKQMEMVMVFDTDSYYLRLANKVLKALKTDDIAMSNGSTQTIRRLALVVAGYFEDVISSFGLFDGFRKMHRALYGKPLPFLDLGDDYLEDEINSEDVHFLIWTVYQEDRIDLLGRKKDPEISILNIDNPVFTHLSQKIYYILSDEYETAPENEKLYDVIHGFKEQDSFLMFRMLINWLHYNSYLSMRYPLLNFENQQQSFHKENIMHDKEALIYSTKQTLGFDSVCTPLAVKAYDWLGHITTSPFLQRICEQVEYRYLESFRILQIDDTTIKVSPVSESDVTLLIDGASLASFDKMKLNPPSALTATLVYYNGLWNVTGFAIAHEEANPSMGFSRKKEQEHVKLCAELYKKAMKVTDNKQIVFLKTYEEYVDIVKRCGFELEDEQDERWRLSIKNYLCFFHPETTSVTIPDICEYIKSPDNPLYDAEKAAQEGLSLFLTNRCAKKELVEYLIDNNLTPDIALRSMESEERGRQLFQENKGFIARFFLHSFYNDINHTEDVI